MAGLAIIIPRAGGSGPIVQDDVRLNPGSLFLIDPAHSKNPWLGVPPVATRQTVPNLAWENAEAFGLQGNVDGVLNNGVSDPTMGLVEMTAKGGLHTIITAAQVPASGQGVLLGIPHSIADYIFAHLDHHFFFSWWGHLTRPRSEIPALNQAPFASFTNTLSESSNRLWRFWEGGQRPLPSEPSVCLGARIMPSPNVVGPQRANVGVSGFVGTVPSNVAQNTARSVLRVGRPNADPGIDGAGSTVSSVNTASASSRVFYSAYIEDLTVSGNTYAQADANDQEALAIAFGPGGRYHDDSWTDPSIVP